MTARVNVLATTAAVLIVAALCIPCFAEETSSSLAEEMRDIVDQQGVDGAVAHYRAAQEAQPDGYDFRIDPILDLSVELFSGHERPSAIGLMEAAKQLFPEDVRVYVVLGQFYWYEDDRARCIENFRQALDMKPDQATANQYWDLLFFVPETFEVPELMTTEHLRVRPLRASDVDLDYVAVMSSVDHLRGVFGPDDSWPQDDLTPDDDLRALKNHEKEHAQRSAFTYTVMDHDEKRCLGCVYIIPCHAEEYDAQVYMWVTEKAFHQGLDEELYLAVKNWIGGDWPFSSVAYPGRSIDWKTWAEIDG